MNAPLPTDPPWLVSLLHECTLDTREIPGDGINPVIAALYETLGLDPKRYQDDTRPWCAVAQNAHLVRAGWAPWPRLFAARGMLSWGMPVTVPQRGDLVCLNRVDPKEPTVPHGHATCYLGVDPTQPGWFLGAGGNQGNRMRVAPYDADRIIGIRRPIARLSVEQARARGFRV